MKQNTMIPWYQKADATNMLLHKTILTDGSIAKETCCEFEEF